MKGLSLTFTKESSAYWQNLLMCGCAGNVHSVFYLYFYYLYELKLQKAFILCNYWYS